MPKRRRTRKFTAPSNYRLGLFTFGAILLWLTIIGKMFHLQVINDAELIGFRENQHRQRIVLEAERGTILDRNGIELTMNLPHYDFAAHPSSIDNADSVVILFSDIFGKSAAYYRDKLLSEKNFIWLERKVMPAEAAPIIKAGIDGISIFKNSQRYYPYGEMASQIIGFTDVDNKGVEGIERNFENNLKGTDGWTYFKYDGKRRNIPNVNAGGIEPTAGDDVTLTIDLEYQTILQEELRDALVGNKAEAAMGLLLQPKTGEILGMASIPSFDPNHPSRYLVENFKNKVITDIYEPGSTFKIVTAIAAMERNLYSEDTIIFCENGSITIAGKKISDAKPYGWLTFDQVFWNSSNVGVIKIAENVGANDLYKAARTFGFGNKTGITFEGEATGILHGTSNWSSLSLAEIAIGYEVSVTPLQLGMAYAAVSNGGYLLRPQLIKSVRDQNESLVFADELRVTRRISTPSVSDRVKGLLLGVVENGTGKKARMPGFDVAGKTGTAQKLVNGRYSNKYYASFVGFFPADDPSLLCLVVVDDPKVAHVGGAVAAPVVKNIFTRIVNTQPGLLVNRGSITIEKTDESIRAEAMASATDRSFVIDTRPLLLTSSSPQRVSHSDSNTKMPDVRGMSIRDALRVLAEDDIETKFVGSGLVAKQQPPPGSKIKKGGSCLLTLEPPE